MQWLSNGVREMKRTGKRKIIVDWCAENSGDYIEIMEMLESKGIESKPKSLRDELAVLARTGLIGVVGKRKLDGGKVASVYGAVESAVAPGLWVLTIPWRKVGY